MILTMPDSWHDKSLSEIATGMAADPTGGLTLHEAAERLAKVGPNELRKGEAISPLALLGGQFKSLVIWVLIGAALGSF
jgi:Ca2+-transporting ATPase